MDNEKIVTFRMSKGMLDVIDLAVEKLDEYETRTDFLHDAIQSKLKKIVEKGGD